MSVQQRCHPDLFCQVREGDLLRLVLALKQPSREVKVSALGQQIDLRATRPHASQAKPEGHEAKVTGEAHGEELESDALDAPIIRP